MRKWISKDNVDRSKVGIQRQSHLWFPSMGRSNNQIFNNKTSRKVDYFTLTGFFFCRKKLIFFKLYQTWYKVTCQRWGMSSWGGKTTLAYQGWLFVTSTLSVCLFQPWHDARLLSLVLLPPFKGWRCIYIRKVRNDVSTLFSRYCSFAVVCVCVCYCPPLPLLLTMDVFPAMSISLETLATTIDQWDAEYHHLVASFTSVMDRETRRVRHAPYRPSCRNQRNHFLRHRREAMHQNDFRPWDIHFVTLCRRLIASPDTEKGKLRHMFYKRGNQLFLVNHGFTFGQLKVQHGTRHVYRTTAVPMLCYHLPERWVTFDSAIPNSLANQDHYHMYVFRPHHTYVVPADTYYVVVAVQKTLFAVTVLPESLAFEQGVAFKSHTSLGTLDTAAAMFVPPAWPLYGKRKTHVRSSILGKTKKTKVPRVVSPLSQDNETGDNPPHPSREQPDTSLFAFDESRQQRAVSPSFRVPSPFRTSLDIAEISRVLPELFEENVEALFQNLHTYELANLSQNDLKAILPSSLDRLTTDMSDAAYQTLPEDLFMFEDLNFDVNSQDDALWDFCNAFLCEDDKV